MKDNKKVVLLSTLAIVSLLVFGMALATAKAETSSTGTPLFKVRANTATGGKVGVTTNYLNQPPKVDKIVGTSNSGINSPMATEVDGCMTCIETYCGGTCGICYTSGTICDLLTASPRCFTSGTICDLLTASPRCPDKPIPDDPFYSWGRCLP